MSTDLLPFNSTKLERDLSNTVSRVSAVPVIIKQVWNAVTCPSAILPWLAWALDVSNWDTTWTDDVKRATIANSVNLHRHSGTIGALKSALIALGYAITVNEYVSGPYTFGLSVDASSSGIPPAAYAQIESVALDVKNVRSKLTGLTVNLVSAANIYQATFAISGEVTAIYPVVATSLMSIASDFEGSAEATVDTASVLPA